MNDTVLKRLLVLGAVLEAHNEHMGGIVPPEKVLVVEEVFTEYLLSYDTNEVKREVVELIDMIVEGVR